MSTTVAVSGPSQLIGLVPFTLGFHPHDALVIICLDHRSRLGLIGRVDLPTDPSWTHDAAESLARAAVRESAAEVMIIGYETTPGSSTAATTELGALLTAAGLRVFDTAVVRGDQWTGTHQDGWEPIVTCSAATVEMIGEGVAPALSREAVADRLTAGPLAATVGALCDQTPPDPHRSRLAWLTSVALAWAAVLGLNDPSDQGTEMNPATAAEAISALRDTDLRDSMLPLLMPGTGMFAPLTGTPTTTVLAAILHRLPSMTRLHLQHQLEALCAMAPDRHAAPVATLLACVAWHGGDGAVAALATDRALTADPTYTLATLVQQLITIGGKIQ